MKLEITKDLKNNNYEVAINISEISEEETELFSDFGSLSINIGGKFYEDEEKEVELFSTGDLFKRFPVDMPISKTFTQAVYGVNAEKVAIGFTKEIQSRIESAITELKAKEDGFSGTTEVIL